MILSDDVEGQVEKTWTPKKSCQLTFSFGYGLDQTCTIEMITYGEIHSLFEYFTMLFLDPFGGGMTASKSRIPLRRHL